MEADSALKAKEDITAGRTQQLQNVRVDYATAHFPPWPVYDSPVTDTLRIYNLPIRATMDDKILREAFWPHGQLLDIRIRWCCFISLTEGYS